MRSLAINLGLTLIVLILGGAVLEVASRWLFPVAPGLLYFAPDGTQVDINNPNGLGLKAGLTVRQVTADYDVVAHTGPDGWRLPGSPEPEVLFLGDSFTFGLGLRDEETFAAIYCTAVRRSCSNRGVPGTGTHTQRLILEEALAKGVRPKDVNVFVLAMTSALASGNDLFDTIDELEHEYRYRPGAAVPTPAAPSAAEPAAEGRGGLYLLFGIRQHILAASNLARIVYGIVGPRLRVWLSPPLEASALEAGLNAVGGEFARIAALGREFGFRTTIYVLHPMQDILRGTAGETTAAIRRVAGELPVVDTADALTGNPRAYFFPYDGHLTPAGARRVGEALIAGARGGN